MKSCTFVTLKGKGFHAQLTHNGYAAITEMARIASENRNPSCIRMDIPYKLNNEIVFPAGTAKRLVWQGAVIYRGFADEK